MQKRSCHVVVVHMPWCGGMNIPDEFMKRHGSYDIKLSPMVWMSIFHDVEAIFKETIILDFRSNFGICCNF